MKPCPSLAFKMLLGHKRICLCMLAVFLLCSLILSAVDIGIDSMITSCYVSETDKIGTHHGLYYDLTPNQQSQLQASDDYESGFASVQTQGYIPGYASPVYIGSMNPSFVEIGKIHLLKGRIPKTQNEVVLEEFLIRSLSLSLGDTLFINTESGTVEFQIVGILNNYTGVWTTWDGLQDLTTSLPQVITGGPLSGHIQSIVRFPGSYMDDHFFDAAALANTLEIPKYMCNNAFITSSTINEILNLQIIRYIVLGCLSVAALLMFYNVIQLYLTLIFPQYEILQRLGFTKRQCLALNAIQMGILILSGSLVSILSAAIMSISQGILRWEAPLMMTLIAALDCTLQLTRLSKRLNPAETSAFKRLKNFYPMKSVPLMIALNSLRLNVGQFSGSILAIGLCLAVFCYGIQYKSDMLRDSSAYPEFYLEAPNGLISAEIDGRLALVTGDSCISWTQIKKIRELDGVQADVGFPLTQETNLVLNEKRIDVEYFLLSPSQFKHIQQNCTDEWPEMEKTDYDKLCLLLTPTGQPFHGEAQLETMRYTGLKDGSHTGELTITPIELNQIVCGKRSLKFANEQIYFNQPTLILSESYVQSHNLFPGYHNLYVQAKPATDLDSLENQLRGILASVPNSSVDCFWKEIERGNQIAQWIECLSIIGGMLLGLFGLISQALCFYVRLLTNKTSLGIYQVLGLNKRGLKQALLLEDGFYLLCGIVLSLIILISFCYIAGWNEYFLTYLPLWGLVSPIIMISGLILQKILVSHLLNEDLGSTIAYTE